MKSEAILVALGQISDRYILEAMPPETVVPAKKSIAFSKKYVLAALLAACLLLAACAAVTFLLFDVTFPVSDRGQTAYNEVIYNVTPFHLRMELPAGWSMAERETESTLEDPAPLSGMWSILNITNENGQVVGAIGYNLYEEYEGAEEDPRAIYSQIALGNDYRFDVREKYQVVSEREFGVTALTSVYYSPSIHDGTEKQNPGIVSYDRSLLVYVALEFEAGQIEEAQLTRVAQSIQFQ